MKNYNKKRFICYIHDDIIEMCDDLTNLINNKNIVSNELILNKIKKIKIYTEDAKCHGESMETRLLIYKNKIEEMGFRRTKLKR